MQTVIDDQASVYTLLNTFTVSPERQSAVVESLRAFTEGFARNQPGFVGASVHASLDGHHVVNYVQWQRKADLTAMLATPVAKAHMAELATLVRTINPLAYRVAYVGSREG